MRAILILLACVLSAEARPPQGPRPSQCPPARVFPVRKTCLCSGLCECGCNDGRPCACRATISGPVAAPATDSPRRLYRPYSPSSWSSPPTRYRSAGG